MQDIISMNLASFGVRIITGLIVFFLPYFVVQGNQNYIADNPQSSHSAPVSEVSQAAHRELEPDEDIVERLASGRAFRYGEQQKMTENMGFWEWLFGIIERWISNSISYVFDKRLTIILGGILLVVTVFYLIFRMSPKKFIESERIRRSEGRVVMHNNAEDWKRAIDKAIQEGNYHEAVRANFLYILFQLEEAGLIVRNAGKTNHHYLSELSAVEDLRKHFREMVLVYQQICYGDKPAGRATIEKMTDESSSVAAHISRWLSKPVVGNRDGSGGGGHGRSGKDSKVKRRSGAGHSGQVDYGQTTPSIIVNPKKD